MQSYRFRLVDVCSWELMHSARIDKNRTQQAQPYLSLLLSIPFINSTHMQIQHSATLTLLYSTNKHSMEIIKMNLLGRSNLSILDPVAGQQYEEPLLVLYDSFLI